MFPANYTHAKYASYLKNQLVKEHEDISLNSCQNSTILSFNSDSHIVIHADGRIEFRAVRHLAFPISDILPNSYIMRKVSSLFPLVSCVKDNIIYKEVFSVDHSRGRSFIKDFFYSFVSKADEAHNKLLKKVRLILACPNMLECIISEEFTDSMERVIDPASKPELLNNHMDVAMFVLMSEA